MFDHLGHHDLAESWVVALDPPALGRDRSQHGDRLFDAAALVSTRFRDRPKSRLRTPRADATMPGVSLSRCREVSWHWDGASSDRAASLERQWHRASTRRRTAFSRRWSVATRGGPTRSP